MPYWDFEIPQCPPIGLAHIGFDDANDDREVQSRTAQMLCRALNISGVIGVVGSGVSRGYGKPSWDDVVDELIQFTTTKANCEPNERAYLVNAMRARPGSGGTSTPARKEPPLSRVDRFLVLLDRCEELCRLTSDELHKEFRDAAAALIRRSAKPKTYEGDPLRFMVRELGIRRFLTTNYDDVVEQAFGRLNYLVNGRSIGTTETGGARTMSTRGSPSRTNAASLSPGRSSLEQLMQFAVAAPGFETGVYHLHGDIDAPDGMVLTDRDYRSVYLGDGRAQRSFRDALQVALTGNSLLFVGQGMEEPDLLRPLREFMSHPSKPPGYEHPIFALLPGEYDDNDATEFRQFLYARYNVKVLYYDVSDGIGPGFERLLSRLRVARSDWWNGWQRKPSIRTPVFLTRGLPDGCMIRHRVQPGARSGGVPEPRSVLAFDRIARQRSDVGERLKSQASLLILGEKGAGKGTLGQDLAEKGVPQIPFERRFFATAHFTNDFLCIIEAAALHFSKGTHGVDDASALSPTRILRDSLKSGRNLLVVGGVDRLLERPSVQRGKSDASREWEYPLPGAQSLTGEVHRFLDLVEKHAAEGVSANGRIVLTSALFPVDLKLGEDAIFRLKGPETPDLVAEPGFDVVEYRNLHQLVSTLRGHSYALSVVRQTLLEKIEGGASKQEINEFIARLAARLSVIDLVGRAGRCVSDCIDELSSGHLGTFDAHGVSSSQVLQTVALFTSPVTPDAVADSLGIHGDGRIAIRNTIDDLQRLNLLAKVDYEHGHSRTTAHTTVRNYVFRQLGDPPGVPSEAQRFDLAGWSSEVPDTLSEDSRSNRLTEDGLGGLLRAIRSSTEQPEARHRARAAFSLVRSRWSATAIPRLAAVPDVASPSPLGATHLDAYKKRLSVLLNAVRKMSPKTWMTDLLDPDDVMDQHGILYGDELSWLYNELGLTAFTSGLLPDAYALFRAGQHVNNVVERVDRGHRWCESEINLGLVEIERGKLTLAKLHLEHAHAAAEGLLGEHLLVWRAKGHLGLVHHLMGDYSGAERYYDDAIVEVEKRGSLRASSIFRRHRADLRRKLDDLDMAAKDLHQSIAHAESGRHPDLVHYATLSKANLRRRFGEHVTFEELHPTILFARRVGSPKLEWEALNLQAQLALEQGEYELAARLAVDTLAIASWLGLRLRLAGSLYALGRVNRERGNRETARAFFSSALRMATEHRNQLLVERTEEALTSLWSTKPAPASRRQRRAAVHSE